MAETKAKRPAKLKQPRPIFPKFPIYEALYNLNSAFQSIAYQIEVLDDYTVIPLDTLRLYRMTAEELRSAMNHHITELLWIREEWEWAHYGREKAAVEKHLNLNS